MERVERAKRRGWERMDGSEKGESESGRHGREEGRKERGVNGGMQERQQRR